MFIDYHTHHDRCGHAVGSIEDYIIRGMEIGLHQIGVSDHMPLLHVKPSTHYSGLAMERDELPRYVEEVLRLKEKYRGDIEVLLGLEGEYVEGFEEEIAALLADHPWDYVIGSVHYLGEWDLFDSRQACRWRERDPLEVYRFYYRAIGKAAQSGLFDMIGHFDGIKRFSPIRHPEEQELERQALRIAADSGITLELNTAGLRHCYGTMYPNESILQQCLELGIPVTIGSDAHHPRHVGAGFDEAAWLLHRMGFGSLAVFRRRVRELVSLTRLAVLAE